MFARAAEIIVGVCFDMMTALIGYPPRVESKISLHKEVIEMEEVEVVFEDGKGGIKRAKIWMMAQQMC